MEFSAANYIKLIRDKYNFNYFNIIPCNSYGPNDNFTENKSHLISQLLKKCQMRKINMAQLMFGEMEALKESFSM